ncbi:MAG: PAS domain S-box protein, partial [Planctomycetota bacterium]
QAEEALRQSEERMRSIFENALVGIYRTTPAGRILLANPALVRMLGFDSFEELAERNLEEKGYEPEHARQEFKERMARDGKVVGLETAWAKRDGTSLLVRESATAVRDDARNILYYEGTVEDITARKQAEDALRDAARHWRTTFDALSSSVCLIHMDGTVQQCNEAMAKLLGRTPAEIIGRTCWELVHGTSEQIEGCPFVRAKQTCRRETMVLRAGDRWLDVSVDPVPDEDGRMIAAVHVISDITDRKRAEEALRESEERYRAIFEQAADSIVLIDSDTAGFVEFNDRAHTNLGFTRQEFGKLALADIDVLESGADVAEHVGKVIKSGSDIFETKQCAKNGDVRDIQVNSRPVSIRGKSYIHAIWRDVTEAKRARERLERQAKILANVTDAVAVLAADRTVTYWNRAAERTYGYSAEEVVGGAGLMFLMRPQDDNDELADQIRQAVKTEGRWSHPRWPSLRKDGREIWVNATLSKLDIGTDEPPGTLVVAKDVTEEVLLQERLIRTERLATIGTLASGVAHEMNNLLGGLRGLADVAASDPDTVSDLIDTARAVAVRGGAITARLSSLAKADQPGTDRRIDLPSAVLIAVRMVGPLFGQRRINIEEHYGPTPQTWVSEGKILQVLLNLLVNARDSIGRDGTVRVAVEHDKGPDEFVITVSDTGAGIEPEDVPRLFDPFFTTKHEAGPEGEAPSHLGLGLAESLSIVRGCGGDITVDSAPGQGATFTVRLPVRSAPDSPLAPAPAAEAMPEKGTPILVVDDDKLMRFWLTKHLEEQGYGVTAVDNGRGAIDAFADTPFPYVFLDLLMPGEMDGVATLRKLKETQPGAKFIIISAFTRDNIPRDCLDAAHAVLKKPFGTDDLARAFAGESTSA